MSEIVVDKCAIVQECICPYPGACNAGPIVRDGRVHGLAERHVKIIAGRTQMVSFECSGKYTMHQRADGLEQLPVDLS